MILARQVFQVKFGHMDKVLAAMKAAMEREGAPSGVTRVLTDISGRNFTLVVETEAESLDAFWDAMQAGFADAERQGRVDPLMEYMEWGHREFYTIEYDSGK